MHWSVGRGHGWNTWISLASIHGKCTYLDGRHQGVSSKHEPTFLNSTPDFSCHQKHCSFLGSHMSEKPHTHMNRGGSSQRGTSCAPPSIHRQPSWWEITKPSGWFTFEKNLHGMTTRCTCLHVHIHVLPRQSLGKSLRLCCCCCSPLTVHLQETNPAFD